MAILVHRYDAPDRFVAGTVGTPGELHVKGPQVFRGYWGSDDPAGVLTDDGYLPTGDLVVMDEDGSFTLINERTQLTKTYRPR